MRVNVYAEELTERIEIVTDEVDGATFTGVRFFLELPATVNGKQYQGPFMHRPGDDDSAAVTFWSRNPEHLKSLMQRAADKLITTDASQPEIPNTSSVACGLAGDNY